MVDCLFSIISTKVELVFLLASQESLPIKCSQELVFLTLYQYKFICKCDYMTFMSVNMAKEMLSHLIDMCSLLKGCPQSGHYGLTAWNISRSNFHSA